MMINLKHTCSRFFRDRNGKIVLGQFPNVPLLGWLVFVVAAAILPSGILSRGFAGLAGAFLFVWAYLEITQGVTMFRRVLGAIVLIVSIVSYFR